jgi:hypothetical protein
MINEMLLQPFNKTNCLAMLNTLYPPNHNSQPTVHISVNTMLEHRTLFFKYIRGVEGVGIRILEPLMQQGRRSERGDTNGWPTIYETLDRYLKTCHAVIDECSNISLEILDPQSSPTEVSKRKPRKVDSGVSFSESDRPLSGSSDKKDKARSVNTEQNLPALMKSGSTLEKIAREIRKMREKKKSEAMERGDAPRKTRSASELGEMDDAMSMDDRGNSTEINTVVARSFMDI